MKKSREIESASGKKRSTKPELEAQMAELAASKEAAEKLAGDLHARVLDLTARTAQTGQEIQKARQEAGEATARAAALEAQIPALREEAAAMGRQFDAERAGRTDELKRARQEADEAKALATALEAKIPSLGQQLDAEKAGRADELKGVRQEVAALEAKISSLGQQLDAEKAGRTDELGKAAALKEEAAAIGRQFDAERAGRTDELKRARQEADEATARATALEAKILALGQQLDAEKAGRKDELGKAAALKEEAAATGRQFDAERAGRKDELKKARQEADEATAKVAGLERRILELSLDASHFPALEEEAAALGLQVEEAGNEQRRLQAALDEIKKTCEGAEKENARLRTEAASIGRRLEESGNEQRRLQSALNETQKTREGTDKENARLRAKAVSLEEGTGRARLRIESLERELAELRRAPKAPPVADPAPAAPVLALPEPVPPPPAEAPPPPKPEGSTTIRTRPVNASEAALDPRNLFGPAGDDGRPGHVLLELLSRDSLGAVYRACERATGQYFAVRFMPGQAVEEQTAAIEKEVELLMALPHPNILPVRGSGRRQSRLYITMDLVKAESLDQAKIREIPRLCAIFRDAAEAVHYAHEEGILHGDLNPENILVGREEDRDHALVKDFGLGHLLEGAGAKQGAVTIRLPAYLPPEQMEEMKGKLSVAADVYGLGAALYSALAGRAPFEGQDARQVSTRVMMEEPAPLVRLRPDVPEPLAAIVRRAMAKERSLRYGSAKEMAEALTKFLEGPATGIRLRPAANEERRE